MAFFDEKDQNGQLITAQQLGQNPQYGQLGPNDATGFNPPQAGMNGNQYGWLHSAIQGTDPTPDNKGTMAQFSQAQTPTPQPPPTVAPVQPAISPDQQYRNQVINQIGQTQGTSGFDWNNVQSAIKSMGGMTAGAANMEAKNLEQGNDGDFAQANRTAYEKPILDANAKAQQAKADAANAKAAGEAQAAAAKAQQDAQFQAQQNAAAASTKSQQDQFNAMIQAAQAQAQAAELHQIQFNQNTQAVQDQVNQTGGGQLNVPGANVGSSTAAQPNVTQSPAVAGNAGIAGGLTGLNNAVPAVNAPFVPSASVTPGTPPVLTQPVAPAPAPTPPVVQSPTPITAPVVSKTPVVPVMNPITQSPPQWSPEQAAMIQQLLMNYSQYRGNIQ